MFKAFVVNSIVVSFLQLHTVNCIKVCFFLLVDLLISFFLFFCFTLLLEYRLFNFVQIQLSIVGEELFPPKEGNIATLMQEGTECKRMRKRKHY